MGGLKKEEARAKKERSKGKKMPYKTYQEGSRRSTRAAKEEPEAVKTEELPAKDVEMKDVTNTEYTEEMKLEGAEGDGAEKKKPSWLNRSKEGGIKKLPKEVVRRRRNFRLKKMLTPKAPIMVLNELLGQTKVIYEVSEPTPQLIRTQPALYTARTEYDNQKFTGLGPRKEIAKNICAEQVLQYITTKSCLGAKDEDGDDEDMDGNQENGDKSKRPEMESETPWVSLASLALFKLFNDWQAQGYQLPPGIFRGPSGSGPSMANVNPAAISAKVAAASRAAVAASQPPQAATPNAPKQKKPPAPKGEKTLPENPQTKHPVQLLNEMTGPLVYEQTGQTGVPPNCIFTMAVTVNGTTYSGQGKSKKEAKKAAAISAVAELYCVHYPVA